MTVTSFAIFPLLAADWAWDRWSRRYRWCVKGSLEQAWAGAMRRRWRWWGFSFWPVIEFRWASHVGEAVAGGHALPASLLLLMLAVNTLVLRDKWRRLKRELDEDDEDWFNRGKRGARRLWSRAKQAAASAASGPAPAGAGA